jgi:hypothetical protein
VLSRAVALVRRPGARMMAAFVAVPCALFGLPAAAGVTWLVSDNLIQNFPLRVLVGVDLRHGHAPVWDPYLWSGSPLLSGFNAGAAYPATWLFAVLPGALAWVANEALVEVVAAAGMVVLLRVLGRSWTASGLGAIAFAYGGFMAAQNVHIDLIEAGALLPWAFAALDRLAKRPEGRSAAPWIAMLGASIGLMGLSGAAEPILDGGLVLGVYAVWLVWRAESRRGTLLLCIGAGVLLGLALAGAQLVPGALIQEQSQRAIHDYQYFGSGSMNKSLTLLLLDPLILGTSGSFPLHYFATYSLPEVSSYIGIMPIMGVFGLLARRHRRSPEARRWWIWYGIAALGVVLSWGDFTPLGHVFFHLPLFNRQRLLSRNLLEVDLAVAVLFAAWLDHMFLAPAPIPSDHVDSGVTSGTVGEGRVGEGSVDAGAGWWRRLPGARGWRSDVVLPLIPPAVVVGLQLVLLAGGTWFPHFLHVPGNVTRSSLWPLIAGLSVPSAIALWAMWLVVRRHRLSRLMPVLLTSLLIVDLLLFNGFIQGSPDPHGATDNSATANALARFVNGQAPGPAGGAHRMALFDPDRYYSVQSDRLGQPDLTILRGLDSVQGYGAVVDADYDRATNTHTQLDMNPAALADGTFARLDLGVLLTVPAYFAHMVTAPPGSPQSIVIGATPIPPVPPDPEAPADTAAPPPTPAWDYTEAPAPASTLRLTPGRARTQYLGAVLSVTSVTVPVRSGSGSLRVGLLSPKGTTTKWIGAAAVLRSGVSVSAPAPTPASAVVLEAIPTATGPGTAAMTSAPVEIGAVVARTAGQGTYRLDGALRDSVTPARWRFAGMIGVFCVFTQSSADGQAWVKGGPRGAARVVSTEPWGDQTIRVTTTRPATLVRSEQFASGWQATVMTAVRPGGRETRHAARVRPDGLIQAVAVPAGTSLVHFTYRPHRVLEGFVASAVGSIVTLGLVAWPVVRRRRRGFGAGHAVAR